MYYKKFISFLISYLLCMSNFISDFLYNKLKEKNNNKTKVSDDKIVIKPTEQESVVIKNKELTNDTIKSNKSKQVKKKDILTNDVDLQNKKKSDKTTVSDDEIVIKATEQESIFMDIQKNDKQGKVVKNNEEIQNIEKWVNKELGWYLSNDFKLDNTIRQMGIKDIDKEWDNRKNTVKSVNRPNKTSIKIQWQKPYKNLLWIFIEFLIWVILLVVSIIHINKNLAEYKFMQSSINLWTNTFDRISYNIGGSIWKYAKEGYIKKKNNLISELNDYQDILKSCDKKWKDTLEKRLLNLKEFLTNTNYLTLDKFVDNYEHYKMDVDAIKESVNWLCK